jgi:hypothetical protein
LRTKSTLEDHPEEVDDLETRRRFVDKELDLVSAMHRAGVPFLAGTDTAAWSTFCPGSAFTRNSSSWCKTGPGRELSLGPGLNQLRSVGRSWLTVSRAEGAGLSPAAVDGLEATFILRPDSGRAVDGETAISK